MMTKRKKKAADRTRAYEVKTGQAGTGRTGGTMTHDVATGDWKLMKYVKKELTGLSPAEKKNVMAGNELWEKFSKHLRGM